MEPRACPGCQHQEEFHGTRYDKRWCAICEGPCSHDPSKALTEALATPPDDLEAEVRGLLPCVGLRQWCAGGESLNGEDHHHSCPAARRPAVLAALRKQRERGQGIHRPVSKAALDKAWDENAQLKDRLAHLEAALAKVREAMTQTPHFGLSGYHEQIICPPSWACHTTKYCAQRGGQCALTEALAATGGKPE